MDNVFTELSESRRNFLKSFGALSALVLLSSLGGCEALKAAIANRPTRRRIRSTAEVDAVLDVYQRAIRAMRNLDATSPTDARGWTNQAHIHGTSAGFNYCHRDNREFLMWHRAYLYQFERICQQISGDKTFALPYWNWVLDNNVPQRFLVPSSELNSTRSRTNLSASGVFTPSNLESILDDSNFYSFSERLRGGPHNLAHGTIGGIMGRADSPLDPLFWSHHCMVDYCWYDWNVNRNHNNPNDSDFTSREWNHFVKEDGSPLTLNTSATLLMPLLSYQYEDSNIGEPRMMMANRSLRIRKDFTAVRKRLEAGAPIKFDIKKRSEISIANVITVNKFLHTKPANNAVDLANVAVNPSVQDDRVYLNVILEKLPKRNDFFVRVFVNMPEDRPENSMASVHYAGSFGVFGTDDGRDHGAHTGHAQPTILVELTSTIRALKKAQIISNGDPIKLNLIAVPFDATLDSGEAVIQIAKMELILTPVTVESKEN
jgi:tyrosinase